jgi:hypothetical protein
MDRFSLHPLDNHVAIKRASSSQEGLNREGASTTTNFLTIGRALYGRVPVRFILGFDVDGWSFTVYWSDARCEYECQTP